MSKKRKILAVGCLVCGLVCIALAGSELMDYWSADQEYHELEEKVVTETADSFSVDWDTLLAQNSDVIAWIRMDPGISYPVVAGIDNRYYLRRGIDREYNRNGALFLDCNNQSVADAHAIIYGHHMKNGSMFGDLDLYREESYGMEHPYIWIYTPQGSCEYRIFCAIVTEDGSWVYRTILNQGVDVLEYLDSCRENAAYWDDSVMLSEESNILTLSTCLGRSGGTRRLAVQAVRVK